MENQEIENPRVTPQNLVKENIQETKKENNEIKRPSLIVNATDSQVEVKLYRRALPFAA